MFVDWCCCVFVVDDLLMVCEFECKLLEKCGYDVMVVVDGMEGWNVVCSDVFDFVVIDVDMLCMDGIEFVMLIKSDLMFKCVLVMIVLYKDCDEDCWCGFDVGVDYYFVKSSFYDEVLFDVVYDLIGDVCG